MTKERTKEEAEWITAMIDREEADGPVVPSGAQGGVVARHRHAPEKPPARRSAVERSRERVRRSFEVHESDAGKPA